jgi:PleD family two-component response regulator
MIELLKENYEWLFSGIGATILFFILKYILNKKLSPENEKSITITLGSQEVEQDSKDDNADLEFKNSIRILFVDDEHTKFKMVSILKKTGFRNTKSVKDIIDLDDPKAKEADIIFVDINGVGKTLFEDQGLGLASALKKRYPEKKIIIYSAETKGDRFHKALKEVDDSLSKDAEPYQFINLIESLCQ